jgi:alpha-D-ribose 1-methylphosphonate 5-triphosphate synthase subunit PhnL
MVTSMTTPIVEVRDLNKSFVLHLIDGRTISPVQSMSFTVFAGQHFLIWGRSGVGKTSVLKCIYRTYISTSGSILYHSAHHGVIDMTTIPERVVLQLREQEIGYCSQFLNELPRVTALDIMTEPLRRMGMDKEQAREQGSAWLTRLRIAPHLWQASPVTFSGGEQQRINLGRAFIGKPRLLLLDEPTASLDSGSKQIVLDLIHDAKAHGTTVVTVSHDIDTLSTLADQQLAL